MITHSSVPSDLGVGDIIELSGSEQAHRALDPSTDARGIKAYQCVLGIPDDVLKKARSVLDLGAGMRQRFAHELLDENPDVTVTCVDSKYQERNPAHCERILSVPGLLNVPCIDQEKYDLVVSSFAAMYIDNIHTWRSMLREAYKALMQGGQGYIAPVMILRREIIEIVRMNGESDCNRVDMNFICSNDPLIAYRTNLCADMYSMCPELFRDISAQELQTDHHYFEPVRKLSGTNYLVTTSDGNDKVVDPNIISHDMLGEHCLHFTK